MPDMSDDATCAPKCTPAESSSTSARTSRADEASRTDATDASQNQSTAAQNQSIPSSDVGRKSESVRAYQRATSTSNQSNASPASNGAQSASETVEARELKYQSGASADTKKLSRQLDELTEDYRHVTENWAEDDLVSSRTSTEWANLYAGNDGYMQSSQRLVESIKATLAGGSSDMTNKQVERAVDLHTSRLSAEDAFEGWESHDIESLEKGLETYLKTKRAVQKLDSRQPQRISGLPTPELENGELTVDAPKSEIRRKVDSWEQGELADIEQMESNLPQETLETHDAKIDRMKRKVRRAADMYREIAAGDGQLPEVMPDGLEGLGRADDIPEDADPGMDPHLTPVRERYQHHLEENPGDIQGAWEVVQDITRSGRAVEAGAELVQ